MNLKPYKLLPDGSFLARVTGKIESGESSSKKKKYSHYTYEVRVIIVQIPGFRPFRLITNVLDPNISAVEIVRHYHKRWDIEIGYDELKTHQCATLRGQAPTILRSKRPDLVEQEIYALFIAYNLTRHLMIQAAEEHGIDPLQISFPGTLAWIEESTEQMDFSAKNGFCHQFMYLLKMIAQSPVDRPRRLRVAPRVIKIKMSKFKRKRRHHKTESVDYEKHIKILPPKDNEIINLNAA